MGGCSVLIMLFVLMPVMSIYMLVVSAVYVLSAWVTGPAFPFWIVGVIFDALCLVDIARIAWRKYKERDAFPLTMQVFKRPLILFAIGTISFVVMTVLTGVQVFTWGMEQIEAGSAAKLLGL